MTITVVFDPPLPSDSPATFNTKAFSTLGDLNDWSTEANALAVEISSGVPMASATHAATSKTTPVDADEIPMSDSAASWGLKKLTWANLKATAKTYFDTLYLGISATAANASQLLGATWASPGAIGNTTPSTGAFTTLSATGNATLGDAEATDTHAIKGATTVLANSASPALKVTQTGAGNAFVVEDATSTDVSPFVIDASGRVILGNPTVITGSQLETHGITDVFRFSVDAVGQSIRFFKSRGTAAAPWTTIVASGDTIGSLDYYGADGTGPILAARITASVDGTPGTNDMPGRLVFSTTTDGAASPVERMRIDSSGRVGIGTTTPRYTFHVDQASGHYAFIRGTAGVYGTLFGSSDTIPITSGNGFSGYTGALLAPSRWGSAGGNADYHNVLYIGGGQRNVGAISGSIAFANWGYFTGTGTAAGELGNTTAQGDSVSFNIAHRDGGSQFSQTLAVTGRTASGTQSDLLTISTSGEILARYPGGLGYGTGAGGTVTQATNRTMGVTLNKPTGAITMFTAAGSATPAFFPVTNSVVAANDTVVLSIRSGATNYYIVKPVSVYAGGFSIGFWTSGGTASDTPIINFTVIKGATS